MGKTTVQQTFTEALDALVEQVRADRSVLAAILCGSLSHDTVWEKSDIDLVFITTDDKKVESADVAIYANGVNVHAFLTPRTEFRKTVEGAVRNSIMHSLLAKGRLLYTHDESIADLFARLQGIGGRETALERRGAGTGALSASCEARETRSCTEIENHFKRNFGVSGVTTACEYLADQGLIGKASTAVRLTKKSNVDVQELAFFLSRRLVIRPSSIDG